ncbi:ATP-binding cassette domain-containing protein [Noviherbaspirillum sp. CPCC 100848]|uniref:ATP-binding cassette domain-containing protein n=1 Tax=Noviherbaspirillum album TaxID=3080276 RepID=A0ABU6JGN5_9BURK|nr:ATP-binding cassette domain-containing protein [Noviherbaspirillum sp. CPCC 100848]MEC4722827.1 ATP-binding cassette domain-containing protein [Noviherbaspirillum sp. CPCC 100848]
MLSLNNVSVDIAGAPVLRNVSVELKSARTYAVVGRNGAGKTTLLRTIMGFTTLRSGAITLAGTGLLTQPAYRRAALGVGYAPEERVLFPTMTVLDNLRLPCEAIGLKSAEIERRVQLAIEVVPQIKEMLPRSAAALSGGQGKMAALARAVMVGTRLLMVDEPFQGLAPALARQYAEALSRMYRLQPELCMVITESNRSLLDRVQCTTLSLERGELTVEEETASVTSVSAIFIPNEEDLTPAHNVTSLRSSPGFSN